MTTNLNDPRLLNIRGMNQAGDVGLAVGTSLFAVGCFTANPIIAAVGGAAGIAGGLNYPVAFYEYYNLVGDRKPWDFKHEIQNKLGPGITLCSNSGCKDNIEFSVPGNIHFGFVTRAAGYHSVVTHIGAGFAQIIDPNKPYDLNNRFGPVVGPSGISLNFGDDTDDHDAVEFGVYLYNHYRQGLSFNQFKQELDRFIHSFDTNPPDLRPVSPDIAADWPYRVGYFAPSQGR